MQMRTKKHLRENSNVILTIVITYIASDMYTEEELKPQTQRFT